MRLYACIPEPLLRLLVRPNAFLLRCIVRYRRNVVRSNLRRAFSQADQAQLRATEVRFYRHLAAMFLMGLKVPFESEKRLRKHFSLKGLELITDLKEKGYKTIFVTMGHCGDWELFSASPIYLNALGIKLVNVYKALHNASGDLIAKRLRTMHGAEAIEMFEVPRYVLAAQNATNDAETRLVVFLADQCPGREQAHYGTLFLNQPTTFLDGWARLAHKLGLPVVYLEIVPQRRGRHWQGTIQLLTADAAQMSIPELMERYVTALEQNIRRAPSFWLWSHKRWRFTPDDIPGIVRSNTLSNRASTSA